ncbi:MAG: hypothetical protein ABI887_07725 [Burkholderiales bacterium]
MSDRIASCLRRLAGAALLAAGSTFGGGALAHGGPDIATFVLPAPASVTLAGTGLLTYASYEVTLTHDQDRSVLQPVYFSASTTVRDSHNAVQSGQSAVFVAANLPTGCSAPTPTTLSCTFTDGLLRPGSTKTFTLIVQVPTAGAKIGLTSQTSWRDCGHGRLESTPGSTAYTLLTAPSPDAVASYLPAGGGTLFTGNATGTATPTDPWTTTVSVPTSAGAASVSILETLLTSTCAGDLTTCNSSLLTIPGTFANLTIYLRRDATTISRYAKISSAKVYYSEPAHPAAHVVYPLEVPSCKDTWTYGQLPRSGIPCIAERTAYPSKDDCDRYSKQHGGSTIGLPPPGYEGDWEFRILAVDNGRYIN